jgi:hypothetical protein
VAVGAERSTVGTSELASGVGLMSRGYVRARVDP